mmetsp:Transcript_12964/g.18512  ORF Transcript_12964/g.18512 Transcript_12964/m.18512 type:complete len:468 (+) Transcript_12964:864-2267(+)
MKIASKLVDKDICLSLLDKIAISNEKKLVTLQKNGDDPTKHGDGNGNAYKQYNTKEQSTTNHDNEIEQNDMKTQTDVEVSDNNTDNTSSSELTNLDIENDSNKVYRKDEKGMKKLLFWLKPKEIVYKDDNNINVQTKDKVSVDEGEIVKNEVEIVEDAATSIKKEDLGAVLLSAEEPTITRQLNVLSNIVKRALLFGGDQELLVLSETLEADKPAFIQRWYPDSNHNIDVNNETRPGVQYFNCLVQILKDCYDYGSITELDPPFPLSQSYDNSYERLTAILVELGSGYIKPLLNTKKIISVKPKTATEEFRRFSQWEVALRQTKPDVSDYPTDLVGTWQVKDEIGGKIIGTTAVVFKAEGEVYVDPPLRGLRWRLDPGPTHLDTCTFQVLSDDGAILQYRGFMDRGARLESRFSKRSIKIRGAVTFQMRDGETAMLGPNYKKDMLPISTQTGTTRFIMSKVFDLNND